MRKPMMVASVVHTSGVSLKVPTQPSTSAASHHRLAPGTAVDIRCWQQGTDGRRWLRIRLGYVQSDYVRHLPDFLPSCSSTLPGSPQFVTVYGRGPDPESAYDRKLAAFLYPTTHESRYHGTASDLRALRFDPVPGAGLIRIAAFIQTKTILDDIGDDRRPSATFPPSQARETIYVDYENGALLARVNPTCKSNGSQCQLANPPGVGAIRVRTSSTGYLKEDRIDLGIDAVNPLHATLSRLAAFRLRAQITVTPLAGGGASARGAVSAFPSFELSSDDARGRLARTIGRTTETKLAGIPIGLQPLVTVKSVGPQIPRPRPNLPRGTRIQEPVKVKPGAHIPRITSVRF